MSRRSRFLGLCALAMLLAAGCGEEASRSSARLPNVALHIATTAQSAFRPMQPSPDLAPTFSDGDRNAWSLASLFGSRERGVGAHLEVTQADGNRVDVDRPFRPDGGGVWILRANRRGEAQLELVDPKSPFPTYHGRGGNRGRSGADVRRISQVVELRVRIGAAAGRPPSGVARVKEKMMLELTFVVDGVARRLDEEALADLDPIKVRGDDGQGTRDAWSLRALVRALAGEKARLIAVEGRGGTVLEFGPKALSDESKLPVLRLNRRGRFKFHWTDGALAPTGDEGLRDVSTVRIRSR